jgi:hypothetical protein
MRNTFAFVLFLLLAACAGSQKVDTFGNRELTQDDLDAMKASPNATAVAEVAPPGQTEVTLPPPPEEPEKKPPRPHHAQPPPPTIKRAKIGGR